MHSIRHLNKSALKPLLSVALLLISSIVVYAQVSVGVHPPPARLCYDMNFEEEGVVRAAPGVHRNELNCRVLVEDGEYLTLFNPNTGEETQYTFPASVGNQDILDQEVQQAIDVFSPAEVEQFEEPVVVCLRGTGQLIYGEAPTIPREYFEPPVYLVEEWPGYICTTIFKPGTLVMVDRPAELPVPSDPVNDCTTTTRARLNMRAKPDTSSEVLAAIPFNVQLQPDRVTENGWYRYPNVNRVLDGLGDWEDVAYFNRPGWLHLTYLDFEGTCGQICQQSEDGWTIICPSP